MCSKQPAPFWTRALGKARPQVPQGLGNCGNPWKLTSKGVQVEASLCIVVVAAIVSRAGTWGLQRKQPGTPGTFQGLWGSSGSLNQTRRQPKSDESSLLPRSIPTLVPRVRRSLRLGTSGERMAAPTDEQPSGLSCQESQRAEAATWGRGEQTRPCRHQITLSYLVCHTHVISSWIHCLPLE